MTQEEMDALITGDSDNDKLAQLIAQMGNN
jgi:hypothetical protein